MYPSIAPAKLHVQIPFAQRSYRPFHLSALTGILPKQLSSVWSIIEHINDFFKIHHLSSATSAIHNPCHGSNNQQDSGDAELDSSLQLLTRTSPLNLLRVECRVGFGRWRRGIRLAVPVGRSTSHVLGSIEVCELNLPLKPPLTACEIPQPMTNTVKTKPPAKIPSIQQQALLEDIVRLLYMCHRTPEALVFGLKLLNLQYSDVS